jgi:hypothetical protein
MMGKANHCPYCGAEIDYLPQWETISPPCGGDPAWHEVPEEIEDPSESE